MPGDELKSGSQGSDWGILDVDAGDALLRETGSHIKNIKYLLSNSML